MTFSARHFLQELEEMELDEAFVPKDQPAQNQLADAMGRKTATRSA